MTPLVFVHGFMGGSDQWHLQDPLAGDRPLVRLDLPGFGRNAHLPPLARIGDFAAWALEILTAQGHDRFDLLGHSMGGMIVQDMVRQAPDRVDRLVLYGTGSEGELPGRFETLETSMQRAAADGPTATARRISATWFRDREEAAEYPGCAAIAERSSAPAIQAGLGAMQGWSGTAHLAAIASPTLVIWGDCDRTYAWGQVETLWRSIPDCHLAVLPRAAHAAHLEAPAVFNAILSGFLNA